MADVAKVLARLFKEDPVLNSEDMSRSIFIASFVKPLI